MKLISTLAFVGVLALLAPPLAARTPHASGASKLRGNASPIKLSLAPVARRLAVSTHAPFESKSCDVCHTTKRPTTRASVKRPIVRVCFGCHGELKRQMGKGKLHHGAIKAGCTSCHNPHNSVVRRLLKTKRKALCKRCHAPRGSK